MNKTIESYDRGVKEYTQAMVGLDVDMKAFIGSFLKHGNQEVDVVLEIGSGSGRDADYIESLGWKVIRTDGSQGLVDFQLQQGKEIKKLDILHDHLPDTFHMVYANHVLLHFDKNEFVDAISSIVGYLKRGGIFAFNVREGNFEGWMEYKDMKPRYFKHWKKKELIDCLRQFDALEIISIQHEQDRLDVIVKKV